MAKFSVLLPLATRNLITNPSVEASTDGWNASGSSITRTIDRSRFGVVALRVVTNGVAENEGTFFKISPATQNLRYFGSMYLRGEGKVRIRLIDATVGNGDEAISDTIALSDDRWTRVSVRGETGPSSSDNLRLYVETAEDIQGITFYVDGAQIEQGDYLTTYCDGGQPGCRWNIVKNDSESTRDAQERSGGREVEITTEDIYVTLISGIGMPPLNNIMQRFHFVEGAFFQRTQVLARVVDITFNIKDDEAQATPSNDLDKLHQIRQTLLDYIKPDLARDSQAFIFIYEESNKPRMFLKARYDTGFEGSHDNRNKFFDFFTLRLLAEEPFWFEDTQEGFDVDFEDTIESNFVAGRIEGKWDNLNFGFDGEVNVFAQAPDGRIYAGGEFTAANNDAAAVDPLLTVNRIAVWDGISWSALGSGFNEEVHAIAIAPNGDIYVGGFFTATGDGALALNRIAFWDGSSWNALDDGLSSSVRGLAFHPNGDLYIAGDFTTFTGGAANSLVFCARWSVANQTWHSLGAFNGFSELARTVVVTEDGTTVYFGGNFADEFTNPGSALNNLAQYTVSSNTFAAMGDGLGDNVLALALDNRGILYIGGSFTPASGFDRFAIWNGSSLTAPTDAPNELVTNISVDSKGRVFIIGAFTAIGDLDLAQGIAIWNGSSWAHVDIDDPGTAFANAIFVDQNDDIYTGLSGTEPLEVAHINTINNPGTTTAAPLFNIQGPGFVRWLENQSTRQILYMDYNLADNELLTINTMNATIISSIFGKVNRAILPQSDFGGFHLLPGDNEIAVFMNPNDLSQGSVIVLAFEPRHWSVDAVGL